ncbi:MAG: phage holin family protein [Synergistaceae bacterium]|nr:phage holin family protein [Synergistaceae bacterium]MBR1602153.1 phage holin family protein [Synergistaceae bacterium]
MTDWISYLAGLLGGALGWYFGGLDGLLYALLGLTIVDYISGISAAFAQRELSSSTGFKGIARKVMIFALVGAANVVDKLIFGQADTLRTAVIFFYIANESLSIIENAIKLGVPIPDLMKDKLAQIKGSASSPTDQKDQNSEKLAD